VIITFKKQPKKVVFFFCFFKINLEVKTMAKVKTTVKDIGNTLTSLSTTVTDIGNTLTMLSTMYTFEDFYKDGINTNMFDVLQHTNLEVPQGQHVLISISTKYGDSYEQVAFVNMVHDGSMERTGRNNAMHTEYVVTSKSDGIMVHVVNTTGQKVNVVYFTFTIIGV
jgi:hypothetical protein